MSTKPSEYAETHLYSKTESVPSIRLAIPRSHCRHDRDFCVCPVSSPPRVFFSLFSASRSFRFGSRPVPQSIYFTGSGRPALPHKRRPPNRRIDPGAAFRLHSAQRRFHADPGSSSENQKSNRGGGPWVSAIAVSRSAITAGLPSRFPLSCLDRQICAASFWKAAILARIPPLFFFGPSGHRGLNPGKVRRSPLSRYAGGYRRQCRAATASSSAAGVQLIVGPLHHRYPGWASFRWQRSGLPGKKHQPSR